MSTRILRTALLATITLGAPALAVADAAHPAAAQTVKAPTAAARDQATSYAQREAQDEQNKVTEFRGGAIESGPGGTVIVVSGAALVLVVLLAIVLL
jgi:hypothetical protein